MVYKPALSSAWDYSKPPHNIGEIVYTYNTNRKYLLLVILSRESGVNMNLRDLKYLVAVASTHHFGHAAEQCFVSQPTLSGQIKKLEEELGVILFERTKRSVETTPTGELIVAQAKRVLEQADLLKQQANSYQDPLVGPFRIGIIPTLCR